MYGNSEAQNPVNHLPSLLSSQLYHPFRMDRVSSMVRGKQYSGVAETGASRGWDSEVDHVLCIRKALDSTPSTKEQRLKPSRILESGEPGFQPQPYMDRLGESGQVC